MSSTSTVLSELCHLDFDALAAYEASLERIEDASLKTLSLRSETIIKLISTLLTPCWFKEVKIKLPRLTLRKC